MKIYTKTGDHGETGLYSGPRVSKDDPLIAAYGTVDELNAIVGLLRSNSISPELNTKLQRIQNELFDVGSDLATPWNKKGSRISSTLAHQLEKEIDAAEKKLEPLKQFILPGGSQSSAELHLARTICRRAEREIVAAQKKKSCNPEIVVYMNRLSDWFFMMARYENKLKGIPDVPWQKVR